MDRDRPAPALLGDGIVQLDHVGDTAVEIKQHRPGEVGDLAGSQAGLERERHDRTISLRITMARNEPQESRDAFSADQLGLLAGLGRHNVSSYTYTYSGYYIACQLL